MSADIVQQAFDKLRLALYEADGLAVALKDALSDAVLAEREACARIAETTYAHSAFHFELATAVAAAIRARNPSQG